jgi:methyltransferase (TIGR00027 family)
MKDRQSSETAMGATVIRAAHQLLDGRPSILEDPISPLLIGEDGVREIRNNPERYQTLSARALRSHIVLRSRYAEDELLHAVESGLAQYINLGAGYDTFSFRQPDWARGLKIVEIDHPATQCAKLEAIKRTWIQIPENVTFLPLDLERHELSAAVVSILNPTLPTFVACLGVLAYLRPRTVHRLFESIAKLPEGSKFVFAFASEQTESLLRTVSVAARTAAIGEPWLTRFEVEELKAELTEIGFREVSFLDPSEAAEKYYKDRHDLPAPRKARLCEATVAGGRMCSTLARVEE